MSGRQLKVLAQSLLTCNHRRVFVLIAGLALLNLVFCPASGATASAEMATGENMSTAIMVKKGNYSDRYSSGPVFNIKIAYNPEDRKAGLSGLAEMPSKNGMLFVLETSRNNYFWMKGMRFPLDIIFFNSGRRIVGLLQDLKPCSDCEVYSAPDGTVYALELNSGVIDKHDFRNGDLLVLSEEAEKEIALQKESR